MYWFVPTSVVTSIQSIRASSVYVISVGLGQSVSQSVDLVDRYCILLRLLAYWMLCNVTQEPREAQELGERERRERA